jgi:Holliday junction resolvase RusA-like endonuclease
MKYKFEINRRLPSFNEYTKACRTNRYAGATMKKQIEEEIYFYIKSKLKNIKITKPVFITFVWIEENKKRDLDNICFAKKFILDALQKTGTIENDNARHIKGFIDKFEYADKSKLIVELEEV